MICKYTRYQFHTTAFLLVILHDFLDHVDGIVAKAHRQMFGQVDDPLLGGFMDAFCDKVPNIDTISYAPNSSKIKVLFHLVLQFCALYYIYFLKQIVNVLALWSILLVTDFREFSSTGVWLYVGACGVIIVYEFILGVVRVQDYFAAYYERFDLTVIITIRDIHRASPQDMNIFTLAIFSSLDCMANRITLATCPKAALPQ